MKFYHIIDKNKNCVDISEGNDWTSIKCPKDSGHQRAGKRITDLHIELISNTFVDFSWTILSDLVISENALRVFKEYKLTGYKEKLAILNSKKKVGEKFWEVVVTGKGGNIHPKSGVFLKTECSSCGLKIYSAYKNGILIDEEKWDGSDLFVTIEYPIILVVNENVKNIVEQNRLTNIDFVRTEDLKWPESVIKP